MIDKHKIASSEVERIAAAAIAEATSREHYYRGERPPHALQAGTVILVDDGLATGSSMLTAVHYLNSFRPKKVIAAAPVGTQEAC